MKKILSVSLVMLLAVSVAFSQFGIKGGINLGTLGGDDATQPGIEKKNRLGLVGGISYKIGLIAGLSLQPEVMYIQKGVVGEGNMSYLGQTYSVKTTLKGDYLDIPLLLKFNLPIPMFSPYIEGGVSYGILLSAKQKTETGGQSEETDIKDQVKKNDLSLIVGVGVELFILDINARYVIGQTKLYKEGDAKVFNRGIILTAGLRF
jgi:opacity protein-like surface antigen